LIGNITTDSGNITAPVVLHIDGSGGIAVSGNDGTDTLTITAPEPFIFPTWQMSTLGGNLTWSGQVVTGEAGGNLTIGQVVYFKSDAHWYLAKADAIGTTEGILGISTATITLGNTGLILLFGFIEYDTWNWTSAAPLFISAATAGLETETKPTTTTQFVRRVGYAYSPDIVLFYPDSTVIGL